MYYSKRLTMLVLSCLILLLFAAPCSAGWLFGGESGVERSGLDLVQGYDRNTVVTITGRVAVSPNPDIDPVVVELAAGADHVMVVLGPRWYWQNDDIDFAKGDLLTVRGSRAQGKDGRSYLLVQRLSGPGNRQLEVRSETGRPNWAGGLRQSGAPQRPSGSGVSRHGR